MRFTIFQDSRIGRRKVNQDRGAYSYSRDVLLLVLADGMGGHARGELAAEIAVNTINNRFQTEARTALRRPREFIEGAIHAAHRAIVAYADQNNMLECPRTTVVVCVVQSGRAVWGHVGDSRLYCFRGGQLATSTADHSRVQQLIDAGIITRAQAAVHPDRNKIYNCLGGVTPPTVTLSEEWPLAIGDSLWLSTDGFWAQFDAHRLAQLAAGETIVDLVPRLMLEAERKAGADADNLTVVAVTWEEQESREPSATVTVTEPLEGFTSSMNTTPKLVVADEISEDEIDQAINEIQNAIRKVSR